MPETFKQVEIFICGACQGNPGTGGWGALLRMGVHEKPLSGRGAHTTQKRMELTAAIRALRSLIEPCEVTLHTSERTITEGIPKWTKGWTQTGWVDVSSRPIRNDDLRHDLVAAAQDHRLRCQLVRAEPRRQDYVRVQRLANEAIGNDT